MTKLTLLIDEKTIARAKKIAKKNHTSVSKMAADYFESFYAGKDESYQDVPMLKEISGILYGTKEPGTEKARYKKYLKKKYL